MLARGGLIRQKMRSVRPSTRAKDAFCNRQLELAQLNQRLEELRKREALAKADSLS